MKLRCRARKRITIGNATRTAPAARSVDPVVYWPWKNARLNGAVRILPVGYMTSGIRKSFHVHMNVSTI